MSIISAGLTTLFRRVSFLAIVFFELEDEILQYYDLVPPDTYYYQSALQLKMAKIKATGAEGILKELSDFMIPLQNKIAGEVLIYDPVLIEISSITQGMYDMPIEYEELVCGDDENYRYSRKPAVLHFNEPDPVRILLDTYGYNAVQFWLSWMLCRKSVMVKK